jgi:hypothetical protein
VTGRRNHIDLATGKFKMVTIAKADIVKRTCRAINDRTKNGGTMTLFQFGKISGVITMMMRNENMAKLPAGFGHGCLGRCGVASINPSGKVDLCTNKKKTKKIITKREIIFF